MIMKRILLTGLIIIAGIALQAQPLRGPVREKANYELASRFSAKKINKMVFSTGVRPNWFKTSDLFWYVYKTPEGKYVIVAINEGEDRKLSINIPHVVTKMKVVTSTAEEQFKTVVDGCIKRYIDMPQNSIITVVLD